jgi:outer membrane protein
MENKNKLSLIISVLSLIGVVALWTVYLTSKPVATSPLSPVVTPGSGHSIAYLHTDSILANYQLVKESADQLAEKTRRFDADITRRQNELEKEAAYFQESVQKNALSEKSAQEIYQKLMEKQQSIMELKERYHRELANDEYNINQMLVDTVTNFLKRYNRTLGFDYILGYNKTGNIFYTNDTFDITPQLIAELNKSFELARKSKSKK